MFHHRERELSRVGPRDAPGRPGRRSGSGARQGHAVESSGVEDRPGALVGAVGLEPHALRLKRRPKEGPPRPPSIPDLPLVQPRPEPSHPRCTDEYFAHPRATRSRPQVRSGQRLDLASVAEGRLDASGTLSNSCGTHRRPPVSPRASSDVELTGDPHTVAASATIAAPRPSPRASSTSWPRRRPHDVALPRRVACRPHPHARPRCLVDAGAHDTLIATNGPYRCLTASQVNP